MVRNAVGRLAMVVGIVFALSCSDPSEPATNKTPPISPQLAGVPASDDKSHSEFPAILRADAELTAVGPLVPGKPITIQAVGTARFEAASVDYQLILLDDAPKVSVSYC